MESGKMEWSTCPTPTSGNTAAMDLRSPEKFDNKYYVDLMNRQGLFTSDQDLYSDWRTRGIVVGFAVNESLFFERFVDAVVKMSQLSVVTGNRGEIRANYSVLNEDSLLVSPVVVVGEGTELREDF